MVKMTQDEALDFFRQLEAHKVELILRLKPESEYNAAIIRGSGIVPYGGFLNAMEALTDYRPPEHKVRRDPQGNWFMFPTFLQATKDGETRTLYQSNDTTCDDAIRKLSETLRAHKIRFFDHSSGKLHDTFMDRAKSQSLLGRLKDAPYRVHLREGKDGEGWKLEFRDPEFSGEGSEFVVKEFIEGLEGLYRAHIGKNRLHTPKPIIEHDETRSMITVEHDSEHSSAKEDRDNAAYAMAFFIAHPAFGSVNFPGSSRIMPRMKE